MHAQTNVHFYALSACGYHIGTEHRCKASSYLVCGGASASMATNFQTSRLVWSKFSRSLAMSKSPVLTHLPIPRSILDQHDLLSGHVVEKRFADSDRQALHLSAL